jgi:hypothetical protein
MPSASLASLQDGLEEVRDLQRANPTPTGLAPRQPEITQAIGRASVVILSSHLEGYIDGVNLEVTAVVNHGGVDSTRLPQILRLVHSKPAVEALAATAWEGNPRALKLAEFLASEGWLWAASLGGRLEADRLLIWMKSPMPDDLVRYYRHWGIEDIFQAITRAPHVRSDLRLRIKELVEKRNAIAHGDQSTAATQNDVVAYIKAVATFAERADRVLAQQVSRICGTGRPW